MADDEKTVRLVHPDLPDAEFYCHPDAVASWQGVGWKRAGVTVKSKKEKADG